MTVPRDQGELFPAAGELADEHDQDGWDREKHGTFAEHATPDDTVKTVPADDYLLRGNA